MTRIKEGLQCLKNIMNPTNVGAIFRSAAALHMDAVILTGGCSNPLYRRASPCKYGDSIPDSVDICG